ncbi:hypothetical protein GGE65_004725 [Skermanella aerolata]|uniref:AtuA-like ferredoxin-fold domain-containing protein n=1 Tax=Skermanella aerolata TaxID=393310 RepID=A0A512E1Y5_9PROT|nr:hypothetical protein [Skermanella aerolata]KJB90909.1 beta-lactamase [Skermanella aerolata KACC 11604]GEO42741.1 hypothetical protein SAE02_68890 [Skermanella aerolata]
MSIRLHDIAHCRAGDKGNTSTLSVFAYDPAHYPLLCRELTAEAVKAHLFRNVQGDVTRYEMPNVDALQFVCRQALHSGVTTSLTIDPHGKCLSSELLEMQIPASRV